jgi:hypothetical protein
MNPIEQELQDAVQVHEAGDVSRAEELYRQIVATHPRYAAAWERLGHALLEQGRPLAAADCYEKAFEIEPRHFSAMNNLGVAQERLGRREAAIGWYDRALELRPDFLAAHKNKAFALVQAGRFVEAAGAYEAAVQYGPDDAELHKSLGLVRLMTGDFAGGWPEYAWRYRAGDPPLPPIGRPLWDGSSLYGKTILLVSEPGLGDDVHFIRYAAWLKERHRCRILFLCRPPLRELLATCQGIDAFVEDAAPHLLPPFDVFAPLMHLPGAVAHTPRDFPADVPYLSADAALVEHWRLRLAPYRDRKIGIHWRASPTHRTGEMRSIPIAEFGGIAALRGMQLFSLQKGAGASEVSTLASVVELGSHIDETTGAFVESAAVLKNLDLLITCDTAIAHVAGALNVPVWVALCSRPDWRWGLSGDTTVWYPTMRLFRQTRPDEWSDVMERIAAALAPA